MASSGDEGRVVVDLRSAAESAAANEEAHATPLHEIESLCMRCGENVSAQLTYLSIFHDSVLFCSGRLSKDSEACCFVFMWFRASRGFC
jgi:hypothetical protein